MSRRFIILLTGLGILLAHTITAQVRAQSPSGQPVAVPWSVENTPAQSRIRQYEHIKALGNESGPAHETPGDNYVYAQTQENPAQPLHFRTNPAKPETEPLIAPSTLEAMYARRSNQPLEQFGYNLFGVPDETARGALNAVAKNSPSLPSGAVQDDFILGEGDTLEIMFSGQRTDRRTYRINRQGMLLIDDFPPVPAAGRSIGQVRISLEAAARQIHNTQIYISLAGVRQIGVLVVGHVKRPGRRTLTVFHTALDALMESGGVEKTGSLRRIKLVRGGRSTLIDLYGLLIHGAADMDLQLRDGDRIIVPPVGPTLAVAGDVKRPGIYEMLSTDDELSLEDMLDLSGGSIAPGKIRYLKLTPTAQGKETVEDVRNRAKPQFSDGSILILSKGEERRAEAVKLTGHTLRPGLYALSENKTLGALLSTPDLLGPDIYPLIGVIARYDAKQLTRTWLDFPLKQVIKGRFDRRLEDGDTLYLFSNAQIKALTEDPPSGGFQTISLNNAAQIKALDPALAGFLRERAAFLRGAVRTPGAYPVSEETSSLKSILATAGGLALEADTANIEITSAHNGPNTMRQNINFREDDPKDIRIGPGDSVRVNQKFDKIADKSVLIMGEVRHPGRYDLLPGDRLSDLMERAGGLTGQAYAYGAIFSRESERRAEEARFQAQARDMERAIAAALETDDEKVNAGKIAEARALASELRGAQGVGRITMEADPGVLKARPQLDMLLEAGDRLFIPKRSLTVRVSGEVLSPASLQFREDKASLDYIHEAGGFTFHADKDRTFVLYPDGSAQPLQVSAWNYKPVKIPPGSTIIVPRDPKPFDFIQSAKDVSQILSNLAITAIFIDDLKDN